MNWALEMLIKSTFWNFGRSMSCEHKLHLNPSSKEALLITLEALQPIKITLEHSNEIQTIPRVSST